MKIVKRSYTVAVDDDGNTYDLLDYGESTFDEEIIYENVEVEISTYEEQDKYDDGSYARSYTEYKYFKPNK